MSNKLLKAMIVTLGAALLGGISLAHQSSAPSTPQIPAPKTTPATPKTQKPAAKPGTSTAAKKPAAAPFVLKTEKEKASYAIGMSIGKNLRENFKKDDVDISADILARGLKDAVAGERLLMTDDEAKATLAAFSGEIRKQVQDKNAAFLVANQEKPGVITLPSGLQYKILQAGTGPKPAATDTVLCNYRGTLIDGTEFDSSYKRNQPATFTVGQVIKGWTEALQLMPVGSKWELYVPASLGYGERGTGPIGPFATLIFEIELLSIQPKPQPPQPKLEPVGPAGSPQVPPQAQPPAQPQAQPQPQTPQPQTPPPAQPPSKP
jgi:FKBP-type peptidyl-prolyl cis-trans isomerase FklB